MLQAKKVATATIFGVVIFATKTVVPTPLNKMFIVVQALLLGLGNLLLNKKGATYVTVVGGVLTALSNVALAPFTFSFALLYGLLVDGLFFVFNVNAVKGELKTGRSMAAMTLSTVLVGLLSYYTSVWLGLIPRSLSLEVIILSVGIFSGAIAGYFVSIIWNKQLASYLK